MQGGTLCWRHGAAQRALRTGPTSTEHECKPKCRTRSTAALPLSTYSYCDIHFSHA